MSISQAARAAGLGTILALAIAGCSQGSDASEAASSSSTSATPTPDATPEGASPTADATPQGASPSSGGGSSEAIVIGRGQEHRITEAGATVVIECDGGGEVYVLADDVTVTITGSCSDLDVERGGAEIDAEAVNEIDINGEGNDVVATDVGELDITGNGNTIDVDTVGSIDIEGDANLVTFGSGNPDIDDEGSNNLVTARPGG